MCRHCDRRERRREEREKREKKHEKKEEEREKKEQQKEQQKHEKKEENANAEVNLISYNTGDLTAQQSLSVPDSVWVTGAPLIWSQGVMGEGVIVGIIDTGVDDTHPVLQGKVVKRRDYVKDGRPSIGFNAHGTHVAGTICGETVLKGVAPKAKIHDYRVLNFNGSGSFVNVTQAVRDATNDGCHIINMSLGGPVSYAPLRAAIQYAVSKGVLVVVASGNEGPGRISYPGSYPEVVSVGAVQFDSSTGHLTLPVSPWFSNTNPHVDVSADGYKVLSCIPNNKYATLSGTSMATPHVVGFACLLRNRLINKLKRTPTENELYTALRDNTVDVPSLDITNPFLIGSGFVTAFPEIPKKIKNLWVLPSFQNEAP
jgi:major intracellular serine protease